MKHLSALLLLLGFTTAGLHAQPFTGAADSVAYQGLLTDHASTPVADAAYAVVFTLYDAATGGTSVWTELQSVMTLNGIYNVTLGRVTPLSAVGFDQRLWLGVKVGADAEMTPRTPLASVPYALSLCNLRIQPESATEGPNLIGGWSGNTVSVGVVEATIAGGGDPDFSGLPVEPGDAVAVSGR
jgi:hypothetical protein